jgi:hypothetical protein
MSFVVAGCVLFLGLLASIVLDDTGESPLSELRPKHTHDLASLLGGNHQAAAGSNRSRPAR